MGRDDDSEEEEESSSDSEKKAKHINSTLNDRETYM